MIQTAGSALILTALLSLSISFGQVAEAPAQPRKPLRERLLERALKGDAGAQFDLGKNYETGRIGLPKDFAQAEHWYREAAGQGDPYAQASLGILFNFGKGVPKDDVQALMWYELAVSHSSGPDRESITELRDNLVERMAADRILEARRLAKEWKPSVHP